MKYRINDMVVFRIAIPESERPKNKYGPGHTYGQAMAGIHPGVSHAPEENIHAPASWVLVGKVTAIHEEANSYEISALDGKTYTVAETDVLGKTKKDGSGKWTV